LRARFFDEASDLGDGSRVDDAAARREDSQCVALELEEAAQRRGGSKPTVDAVEGVQEGCPVAAVSVRPRVVEERLRCGARGLADEAFAGSEPRVDGGAAEAELRRDREHVDAAPAQVAVQGRLEDVLATRGRRPSAPAGKSGLDLGHRWSPY